MLWDGIARRAFGLGDGGGGEGVTQIAAEREPRSKLKIGLALGGGAARGWSHIGVMRVLQREGIVPDVIAGSSVGAVVAGCYAADKLDQLEEFAVSLTKRRVMGLLDFHITGSGLIAGDRLRRLLEHDLADLRIENLPLRFATIATELGTGHEIWITRGPLVEALQGLLCPARRVRSGEARRPLADGRRDRQPDPGHHRSRARRRPRRLRQPQRRHPHPRHGHPIALGRDRGERRDHRGGDRGAAALERPQSDRSAAAAAAAWRTRHRKRHGRRLQHHPGPHRPLAPRRRSPRHDDLAEARRRSGCSSSTAPRNASSSASRRPSASCPTCSS